MIAIVATTRLPQRFKALNDGVKKVGEGEHDKKRG